MGKLILCSQKELLKLTSTRTGETKLGEQLQTVQDIDTLSDISSKFVLTGLPEDIGVRANFGIGGTHTAWLPALKAITNIQSTAKLQGAELAVL
ncbi:MAG: arginase, partial [Daejeonella sp.]